MYQEYFDAGFRVFGLHGVTAGKCDCGNPECLALYKHPISKGWQKTPQWSQSQLDVMDDSGQFETGFGVLCDGYLVIDVDPRNGGMDSFEQLCTDLNQDLKATAGLVVATGGGGWHIYYKRDDAGSLTYKLPAYPGIEFKSSGFVVGYGSMHASGNTYEIERGDIDQLTHPPERLLTLLSKPDRYRAEHNGQMIDVDLDHLQGLLAHIQPDDYEVWIQVGMAIHHATGGDGFTLWDTWSQKSDKYNAAEMDFKWHSFGKSSTVVTYGTLRYLADQGGYVEPVSFSADPGSYKSSTQDDSEQDKIDLSHIDIYRPPGLAGRICDWINQQCRYPRERLAAISAIVALGNIAGLKYQCAEYGVTTNLFAFCVAGSATGKEAIMQSMQEIMRSASDRLRPIGSIKSEQEIIRTLIENPMACLVLDEVGYTLKKIKNAQQKGGAAYLEGIIGMLMSAYSKADAKLSLGADQAKEAVKLISTELAAIHKAKDENLRYDEQRLEDCKTLLESLSRGYIDRPFLSMLGFTTPVTFDQSVDYENATNGFFGRAIIIREPDTNPKAKRRFRATGMDAGLQLSIAGIYAGSRIGMERHQIPTTDAAMELLDRIQDELHTMAEEYRQDGLEAIPRRAFEQVLKISLICSIGEGVRDVQHVEYAYALALHDTEYKANLAASNRAAEDNQRDEELLRRIYGLCDSTHGVSTGVICNRLRKFKREDITKGIEYLEQGGKIKKEITQSDTGRPKERWVIC